MMMITISQLHFIGCDAASYYYVLEAVLLQYVYIMNCMQRKKVQI